MKLEPIDPAPPMTQTFLPLISWDSFSLFASISGANILTGRKVTLSEMNLSKLNIYLFVFFESGKFKLLLYSLFKSYVSSKDNKLPNQIAKS